MLGSVSVQILLLLSSFVQADSRLPVPSPADQKESEKLIREIFKDEYSKKGAADRQAFTRKLLTQARESKEEPVTRYVLLREARSMAADLGDSETALAAAAEIGKDYAVDGLTLRLATISTLAQGAKTPADLRAFSTLLLKLADEAVDADNLEVAEKSASAALQLASKSKDVSLVTRAQAGVKQMGELKVLREKVRKAIEDLAKDPADPAANSVLGHYTGLIRGKWEEALPLLAKGTNETLKALAESDLAAPADSAAQSKVGDGWWALSEKESGTARLNARRRAAHWYEKAHAGAVGLTKTKLEKRMAELGITTAVDLLSLVDVARDKVQGDWALEGGVLTLVRGGFPSRIQIPYEPPLEYDLTVVAERIEGQAGILIGLVRDTAQVTAAIDDHAGTASGLATIDGKLSNSNETTVLGLQLTTKKAATLLYSVRRDDISVSIDGKKLFAFKGGNERLANYGPFVVPNRRALSVGCGNARYAISKMTLQPVSGQGRVRTDLVASPNFDPVGSWVKQDTGTEFVFKAGGVLEIPKSLEAKYRSGTWTRTQDAIVLGFPNGERIELRITDQATLSGSWNLKRK